MSLFCRHKWKTIKSSESLLYSRDDNPEFDLPIRRYQIIEQQCENWGKQIVRKYRI
jgi:hypothetical protein